MTLDRHAPATYWRHYRHLGSVRAHSVSTLLHCAQLYRPLRKPTPPQKRLHAAALAELGSRAATGRADAQAALNAYNP